MPLIRVETGENRITEENVIRIIDMVTNAYIEAIQDESMRETTWCVVQGVPARQWGVGGKPWASWDE